jgi:hypothetical protein
MQGHAVNAHRVLETACVSLGMHGFRLTRRRGASVLLRAAPPGLLPGGLGAENRSTLQVVGWFGHVFPTVLQKTPRNKINHKKTQNKINHPVIFFLVLLSIRTTTWQVFSRRHFPLFHHVKGR